MTVKQSARKVRLDPVSVSVLTLVLPGLGHLAMGRVAKGLLFGVLIIGTFFAGWVIGDRQVVFFGQGRWHVFVQLGTGAIAFVTALGRPAADPGLLVHYRPEIGTLYTMVAGLLNVLVIMDAIVTNLRQRRKPA
jgi:hypothetical protein